MNGAQLIASLAGELLIEPALLVETIREDEDLVRLFRSYNAGDFTYAQVLETLNAYV